MTIYDGHIHIYEGKPSPSQLLERFKEAGIEGGALISLAPESIQFHSRVYSCHERLDNLSQWCDGHKNLFSLYWIDPTEKDASRQVEEAVSRGVNGFKVACNHFYPGDSRVLPLFQMIADTGRPILFHSGIFWDGQDSSKFCRPVNFEALITLQKLRFLLAHVSWPWCDECLAVYGKFLNGYSCRPEQSAEMFIDITPGTPPLYREEVLRKIYLIGYDIEGNTLFGSDSSANDYNVEWVKGWLSRDQKILKAISLSKREQIGSLLYRENLFRFLGLSSVERKKESLKVGE